MTKRSEYAKQEEAGTAELNVSKELLDAAREATDDAGRNGGGVPLTEEGGHERAMNAEISDHLGYEPG